MTVQTTTVHEQQKLARAKARYNRLHALYKSNPCEGNRLSLIKAMDIMRDIERAMR